ncbi:MAG: hypothetical protein VX228_03360, partial [Pseudomonadota bacterium]|nr:hypothetical protein [Pseudomonadota bacterium]
MLHSDSPKPSAIRLPSARTALAAAFCATALVPLQSALAQSVNPLDAGATRLGSFETGNMYPKGTLELNVGARQTSPDNRAGTGNQNYHGGGNYAFADWFTLGFELQNYVDPVGGPIDGFPGVGPENIPQLETNQIALWGKYQIYKDDRWAIAALGSAELFTNMQTDLWGNWFRPQSNVVIGALKMPISYTINPKLQLHFTPGIALGPDTIDGGQFYGNMVTMGAGVSYKAHPRLSLFGTVESSVGSPNTIANNGEWVTQPVWSAGGRYNVTPRIAFEGYVTNGFGISPGTSTWAFWPDGDHLMVGGRLIYTPGDKHDESYRTLSLPATQAQLNPQQDGFTLASAATLDPGLMRTDLWYGSDNNAGASINFSPDRDIELQFIFEQFSDNTTADASLVPTTNVRYMLGPKLRLMDQNNGNPFSLAGRMLYGRQISSSSQKVGVFFTDLTANYKTRNGFSFTASPKVAAWGSKELVGLGLGVGYTFGNGLELMAEATPIARDGDETTWAAGARYHFGRSGFSVDAQVTNAIGRHGIGSMIAQDDPRLAVTLSKTFDMSGL